MDGRVLAQTARPDRREKTPRKFLRLNGVVLLGSVAEVRPVTGPVMVMRCNMAKWPAVRSRFGTASAFIHRGSLQWRGDF
jgi:hypothetical protein